MKTLLHKNLHNGLIAITQRGIVVGYCESATLLEVDIREDAKKAHFSRTGGKRTVHLWFRGTLIDVVGFQPLKGRTVEVSPAPGNFKPLSSGLVRYNPKRKPYPYWEVTGAPFVGAMAVVVTPGSTIASLV